MCRWKCGTTWPAIFPLLFTRLKFSQPNFLIVEFVSSRSSWYNSGERSVNFSKCFFGRISVWFSTFGNASFIAMKFSDSFTFSAPILPAIILQNTQSSMENENNKRL